jgi:hypothetical protein
VAEELDAQPGTVVRALDEPGNVGEDQDVPTAHLGHAQVGVKGGEGVGGDLWPRPGEGGEQGGLAGVGEPDQADIGDQLELQMDAALRPGVPQIGDPGSLADRTRKVGVPAASAPPFGDHQTLAEAGEVADQLAVLRVGHDRTGRHGEDEVRPVATAAQRTAARPSVRSMEAAPLAVTAQAAVARLDDQDDAPAPSPVTTIGAAARDVLLAPEADRAAPTGAGGDIEADLVDEHG